MTHKERVEVRSHYDQARETDNPALVSAQRSYPIILMYILYCHSGDLALHGMLHLEESDRTGQDRTRQDKTRVSSTFGFDSTAKVSRTYSGSLQRLRVSLLCPSAL